VRNSVQIVEVSPRDGLQNEATFLPTPDKRELISRLVAAGVPRIEVTSFVNPSKVPQLADAAEVCANLPGGSNVAWSGLVLNDRGLDRALAAGLGEVNLVVVATDTFSRRNQGVDTAGAVATWTRLATRARAAGVSVTLTVAAAFGCPFEGEVSVGRVREVLRACAVVMPDEVAFADTIGVGVPTQVEALGRVAADEVPGLALRWHFHNTRNTGYVNAWTAVRCSDPDVALALDSSAGGIGGCPFAPAATGNIATADLVEMLERSGIRTGIDVDALLPLDDWLSERLGKTVPGQLGRAGRFPASSTH
jgi:hydroxymethylglutaryl-CoA lyase